MSNILSASFGMEGNVLLARFGIYSESGPSGEIYAGPYEATPTTSEQTFATDTKTMADDFVVHAMPSGLLSATATVSGDEIGSTASDYPITITPKANVSIAGYVSSGQTGIAITRYIQVEEKNVSPASTQQIITPTAGKLIKKVTVAAVTPGGGGGDAVPADIRDGKTAEVGGILITGSVPERDATDLTASGATVTVPAGIYDTQATKSVASGTLGASVSVNGSVVNTTVSDYPITATPRAVVGAAGYVDTSVNGSTTTVYVQTEEKTATPGSSEVVVTPSNGKLLKKVTVSAVATGGDAVAGDLRDGKTAVVNGSLITGNVTERSASDLTASGATVTVPKGIYDTAATKTVASGSVTPTVTVSGDEIGSTVSDYPVTATPAATVSAGFVSGNETGTAVTRYIQVEEKSVTPGASAIDVTPTAGKLLKKVTVAAVVTGGNAVAADIRSGKTAVVNGALVTGNVTERSSSDLTASGATVTVPKGIYDTAASKSVASGSATTPATTVTANPTISVSSGGLITASVSKTQSVTPTVSAGYVSSGTAGTITVSGSNTNQLTTKAAATYTPGTTDQTIASGRYLTGTQTIKGDANLIAANIKKDVTIFGVTGTHEGGTPVTEPYVEETYNSSEKLTAAVLHGHTNVRDYMFYNSTSLTAVTMPSSVTTIGNYAFSGCTSLVMNAIPSGVTEIGQRAFYDCAAITLSLIPSSVTSVSTLAFRGCNGLINVEIAATSVGNTAFSASSGLAKVWFRSTCTTVSASSASYSPFNGCPTSLKIYCEASSKPSGYGTYFNRTGASGGTTVTVVYNQTTKPW